MIDEETAIRQMKDLRWATKLWQRLINDIKN